NVLEAHDGEEAMLIAKCFPGTIHVIVTDLIMPRMSGRDLLRNLAPLRPDMQVIIMSGYPDELMAQENLTPLVPVLRKPFLAQKLLHTVLEVLTSPQPERTVAGLALSTPKGKAGNARV